MRGKSSVNYQFYKVQVAAIFEAKLITTFIDMKTEKQNQTEHYIKFFDIIFNTYCHQLHITLLECGQLPAINYIHVSNSLSVVIILHVLFDVFLQISLWQLRSQVHQKFITEIKPYELSFLLKQQTAL